MRHASKSPAGPATSTLLASALVVVAIVGFAPPSAVASKKPEPVAAPTPAATAAPTATKSTSTSYRYSTRSHRWSPYRNPHHRHSFGVSFGHGYSRHHHHDPFCDPWGHDSFWSRPVPPPQPDEGTAWVKLNVRPRNAEVRVDGAYKGLASAFDGIPGYLVLPIGEHELELVVEGQTVFRETVVAGERETIVVKKNYRRR